MKNQVSYLRKINIGLCLVFFLTGLIMEVVFFLIRFGAEELAQPVGNYLIWHLILPSGINLVLFLAAILLMKRYKTDSRSLNYIPVVTLVLQVAVLGTFHYSYSLLMTLFLFPIFLETVYGDRDLCQTAILLSFRRRAGCPHGGPFSGSSRRGGEGARAGDSHEYEHADGHSACEHDRGEGSLYEWPFQSCCDVRAGDRGECREE